MEIRQAINPRDMKAYDTARIREEFLIRDLFRPGRAKLVYCHTDRMIAGGVCPVEPLPLAAGSEIRAGYFLERREMGIINVGPRGTVTVDGEVHRLGAKDGLYIGMGAREVIFASDEPGNPARFYFNSAPAHQAYPTVKIGLDQAQSVRLGAPAESNERTIHKYIHPEGVKSCQLVMGLTILASTSMWNSMPCHLHSRRMEIYFYFDLPRDANVFHFMGEPGETRHIIVRNEEAVISPSWSIHCGVGTRNYAFIWGMAGENQAFSDMDPVAAAEMA
ncbi:MAG: 5-dehydro-4-deoxy-D-glucuronate isomerase [Bacteroidota bacterium]